MQEPIKLNAKNLSRLPDAVAVPAYDRLKTKTGIVHIGVGAFHRAHEAFYTDQVLHLKDAANWGICGVGLLDTDRRLLDTLADQDGLYTLLITWPDGTLTARVIGSVTEYLFAPDNPGAVLEKLAHPDSKIISLTITEGGYNFNASTGEFQMAEPPIQYDLNHPENPVTVFGYLTQALKRRRDRGVTGLTIQSCDNIQHNGDVLKKMLLSYVNEAEPGLTSWILQHVAFPNCMVDRITPVTTPSAVERLRSEFGIEDSCPVVCEPFIQWVIEDHYANGRPVWESAGVQFVADVSPYEKMKIRLLNAGHSLLGFLGTLMGCSTIDEAVNTPLLRSFLREFMDQEVTPVLGKIEGIDLKDYKNSLLQRFGNPCIKDQLSRICSESSAKIPKFVVPTIEEQLGSGGTVKCGALILAVWCRYLELAGTGEHPYEIQDRMGDVLRDHALASGSGDPLAFLKIEAIFGNLAHSTRFAGHYLTMIDSLRKYGAEQTIRNLNKGI